jgi:hypothetical protein
LYTIKIFEFFSQLCGGGGVEAVNGTGAKIFDKLEPEPCTKILQLRNTVWCKNPAQNIVLCFLIEFNKGFVVLLF